MSTSSRSRAPLLCDSFFYYSKVVLRRRHAYWRMSQRVYLFPLSKGYSPEGPAKASVKARNIKGMSKTRNQVSLPWAGWISSKDERRPEPLSSAKLSDDLW